MAPRRTCANSDQPEPGRLLIAGLGNPLMADDGVGHAVVRGLEECELPPGIRLFAIDGDVLALTHLWNGEPAVWLVDAVSGALPAGTLRVFGHRELLELPAGGVSIHHLSMGESLRWMLHTLPEMAAIEFRLYGVEAGVVRTERRLSRTMDGAVTRLVDEITIAARNWAASSSTSLRVRKEFPIPSENGCARTKTPLRNPTNKDWRGSL
ncbi:MAG: hydrogenase maturation protease [Thermoanaerobaculales bacterium]|nr:hydrogenase maturation protease [Thermoanaerobaculales bacterium]